MAPIYWLVVASSKKNSQLFSTATFLPARSLNWLSNIESVFSFGGGEFKWWLLNSFVYAAVSATLCTLVCTVCGYGISKYRFRLRRTIMALVMGSLMIPTTALVVPLFLLEHKVGLTDTYQGVILPLLVNPFCIYFMWIFATDAVPDALIDSSRIDGAAELQILYRIARPMLMPGMVTIFLLTFIGTWNNYFLPLVLLGTESRFPLTVGVSAWASALSEPGAGQPQYSLVILGSLVSVLPMLILFPFLQKYVARGLTFGAIAGE